MVAGVVAFTVGVAVADPALGGVVVWTAAVCPVIVTAMVVLTAAVVSAVETLLTVVTVVAEVAEAAREVDCAENVGVVTAAEVFAAALVL